MECSNTMYLNHTYYGIPIQLKHLGKYLFGPFNTKLISVKNISFTLSEKKCF